MAKERNFIKFVDENKAFGIRWAKVLDDANDGASDTINTSTWAISPTGLTEVNNGKDESNTRTKIRVSGGTAGVIYKLQNTIVLAISGYTLQEYIFIRVTDPIP